MTVFKFEIYSSLFYNNNLDSRRRLICKYFTLFTLIYYHFYKLKRNSVTFCWPAYFEEDLLLYFLNWPIDNDYYCSFTVVHTFRFNNVKSSLKIFNVSGIKITRVSYIATNMYIVPILVVFRFIVMQWITVDANTITWKYFCTIPEYHLTSTWIFWCWCNLCVQERF